MAKTSKKATTTKAKTAKRAAGKSSKKAATTATSRNGAQFGRMSEKSKQATIRAFQMAYKQHHPEEAAAAQSKSAKQTAGKQDNGAEATAAKRKGARPKRKEMTTEEITLKAFRMVYESYHPKSRE